MYRYDDPNDCQFEVGDTIAVYEYMNAEWWLGKNLRTGKEGVFPVSYVQPQVPGPASPHGAYGNEKANGYQAGGYANPYTAPQGPPPPGPSNPYNSSVPPMAIAEQPVESKPGKGQEMGKKFGKKLGNAAIFGAGATVSISQSFAIEADTKTHTDWWQYRKFDLLGSEHRKISFCTITILSSCSVGFTLRSWSSWRIVNSLSILHEE